MKIISFFPFIFALVQGCHFMKNLDKLRNYSVLILILFRCILFRPFLHAWLSSICSSFSILSSNKTISFFPYINNFTQGLPLSIHLYISFCDSERFRFNKLSHNIDWKLTLHKIRGFRSLEPSGDC